MSTDHTIKPEFIRNGINSWQELPEILRRFVWYSAILMGVCLAVVATLRWGVKGYQYYPYNTPFVYGQFAYYDYRMFFDRFKYFHSVQFFTAPAQFHFSYPAPMAVFYQITYLATNDRTWPFLWAIVLTFFAVGSLFIRALTRAGVAAKPAIILTFSTIVLSGPIWFELSRANLEFYVWIFVASGIFLFFRRKGYGAAACFGIAGAMKLFPFVYFGLLLSKKQYRQVVVGFLVSGAMMVGSLWLLCPDILFAWRTLNENASEFGRIYLLQRIFHEVGFDHSAFALIKALWRHLPSAVVMNRVLTIYMAVAAIGGTMLYFFRIRFLPVVNQMICLTVASLLLPPSSSDYTLIHMYAPWAALVFVAIYAAQQGREVPGLRPAFLCLVLLLSPTSEIFFRSDRIEGQIKALALMVLWYLAMKHPFETTPKTTVPGGSPGVLAQA